MTLKTRLTERLGIRYPILNAAMAGTAGGTLAAAVSAAGGLGLIGADYGDPTYMDREFDAAGNQKVGCGFITWRLSEKLELLDSAIARSPAAILLSFGDPAPFVPKIKAAGLLLICQVQTLALAQEALHLGADIVIAQGSEAGGHGGTRGTLPLVPAVVDAAAAINPNAIVAAAGGISDGRGLAAALMLGAEGVLMGTRLHVTEESLAPVEVKARIVSAGGDDTLRGRTVDIARDHPWPAQFSGRLIANDFSREWHGRDDELAHDSVAKAQFIKAFQAMDYDVLPVWASEGIDQIVAVEPAASVMARIVAEAETALARRY
jgi:nitronate monooxygenase